MLGLAILFLMIVTMNSCAPVTNHAKLFEECIKKGEKEGISIKKLAGECHKHTEKLMEKR